VPKVVTGVCKNCKTAFYGWLSRGVYPQFCSHECHYAFTRKPVNIKKRFWGHVDIGAPNECWLWTAGTFWHGYGQFSYVREQGKTQIVYAHRFAYRITKGKIPKGLFVCHSCDNPPCCNPNHLFLGTHEDNMQDRDRKNRQARGESHSRAKITSEEVREIRRLYNEGQSQKRIARIYNISPRQVSGICCGVYWKQVE